MNVCGHILIKKTIYRYEIIVINDGSSDSTLEIASKFKSDKLRIINRSNEGVSCARNVGIKNALGEYLIFCDADDYMKENAVQILLDTAKDTKADIEFMEKIKAQGYQEVKNIGLVFFNSDSAESLFRFANDFDSKLLQNNTE